MFLSRKYGIYKLQGKILYFWQYYRIGKQIDNFCNKLLPL